MFLAIINDTYSEVKAELSALETEKLVEDYFKKGYKNVLGKIGGSRSSDKKPQNIMNALQSAYLGQKLVLFFQLSDSQILSPESNWQGRIFLLILSQSVWGRLSDTRSRTG